MPRKQRQTGSSVQKREFLKRKTEQQTIPRATSKYKYYVDNFKAAENENEQPLEKRSNSRREIPKMPAPASIKSRASAGNLAPQHKSSATKDSKPSFNDWLNDDGDKDKSPEQMPPKPKKPFLARGSGVAGGVGN